MLLPIPLILSLAFAAPTPQGFDTALAARSLITCDSAYCDTVEDYAVYRPVDIKPESTVDCDPGACRTVETMAVASPSLDLDKRALWPIFTPFPDPFPTPAPDPILTEPWPIPGCNPLSCDPINPNLINDPITTWTDPGWIDTVSVLNLDVDLDKRTLQPIPTTFTILTSFPTPSPNPKVTHTPSWIDPVPTADPDPLDDLIDIWTNPGWIDPVPEEFANSGDLATRGLPLPDPLPFPDPHPGHPDLDPLDPLDEFDDPIPSPVRRDNGNDLSKRGLPHTIPKIPIVSPFPIDGLDDPRPTDLGSDNGGKLGRRMQVPEPVPDDGPADGGNGIGKRAQVPEPVPDDDPADGGNGLARRERPTHPFPDPDYQNYDRSLKLKNLKTRTPGQHSGIGGGVGLTHTGTEIGNVVSVDGGDQLKTRMLEQLKTRTPGPGQHSGVGGGVGGGARLVEGGTGVNNGKLKRGVNTGIGENNGKRALDFGGVAQEQDQGQGEEVGHWGVGNGRRSVDSEKRGVVGPGQHEELAHWGVGNGIVSGSKDKVKSIREVVGGIGEGRSAGAAAAAAVEVDATGDVVVNGIVIGSKVKRGAEGARSSRGISPAVVAVNKEEDDGPGRFKIKRGIIGVGGGGGPPPLREVTAGSGGGIVDNGIVIGSKEKLKRSGISVSNQLEQEVDYEGGGDAVFIDWKRGTTVLNGVVADEEDGVVIVSKFKERSMPEEMEMVEGTELDSAAADHQAVFADWEW